MDDVVLYVVVVPIMLPFVAFSMWRASRRRKARVRKVELALEEVATDDPAFGADEVKAEAAALCRDIQAAWTARDRARLAQLVGKDLMVEWERRLDDFDRKGWHNVCEVLHDPTVEYVDIANRTADADDGSSCASRPTCVTS